MLASTSFILVIVVLGVPMWWKTTEVSRVPLPYDGINALNEVSIAVRSTVVLYAPKSGARLLNELRDSFADSDLMLVDFELLPPLSGQAASTRLELEQQLLRRRAMRPGEMMFVEWPAMPTGTVLVGNARTAWMAADVCEYIDNVGDNYIYIMKY